MPNVETVRAEYRGKLLALEAGLSQAHAAQSRAQSVLALAAAALVILFFGAYSALRLTAGWMVLLAVPVVALAWRSMQKSRREAAKFARLHRFYQLGVDRLKGEWTGKGVSGDDFSPARHLYQHDLNLLGAGSMFELLCTARTQVGQRRLASYLLDLPDRQETVARQEAVRELEPLRELREQICMLGRYSFQESEWEPFREWLETPPVEAPRAMAWILPAMSVALALMVLIPWMAQPGAGLWTRMTPYLVSLGLIEAGLALWLRGKAAPVAERTRRVGQDLEVFRQGLALLESQSFRSAKLTGLAERIKGAASAVRKLERPITGLDQCNKQYFYAVSRLLLVDTRFALAIEWWKAAHGRDLADWLDAWAEFEALSALAGYAHEHPEDVFPEMLEGVREFEAEGLGHPLLAESKCVRNDVHLNPLHKFYLVSGSNMAGKSTFLRSIGLNAVLAAAGAPVRARSARMSCFAVCASISIVDSLGEGKSKFMAEVERLRDTLLAASGPKPVLFVIDEILSGTNSHDRRVAAESFVRALIAAGAIGALSTHDLTLAEIAEDRALAGINVHMESRDPADPFAFDYLVKPGVSTHSNGIAIARMAGVGQVG